MTVWFLILWLLPAALLSGMTFAEGESVGAGKWDGWRIAGLVACLAWPLALPVLIYVARRHHRLTALAARARIAGRVSNDNALLGALVAGMLVAMPFAQTVTFF